MLRFFFVLTIALLSLTFIAIAGQPQPPAKDLHGDPLPPGAVARLGMACWLQGAIADFAEFLPDGKTVVTVSDDRTIRLWEFPSGKELHRFSLPAAPPKAPDPKKKAVERKYARAALSKDGKVIAVGYINEPEIYLHETATGKRLPGLMTAQSTGIDALAFSPSEGNNLAAIGGDGKVRIWDWVGAREIRSLDPRVQPYNSDKHPMAYAPNGKSIAIGLIGKADQKAVIKLWDAATGAEIWTIRPAGITSNQPLAFSPDSRTLAVCLGAGNGIMLLEASTGRESGKIGGANTEGGLVFSKDGARIYGAISPGKLMEWDVVSRKSLRETLHLPHPFASGRHVALSPDGNTVVMAGSWPPLFDLSGKDIILLNDQSPQMAPRFMGDGKHLMTDNGTRTRPSLQKWDAVTGKSLGMIKPNIDLNHVTRISPDGKIGIESSIFGALGKAGQAILFDVGRGRELGRIQDDKTRKTHSLCYALFSPDSKIVAVVWVPQTTIELYEAHTAKSLATLNLPLRDKSQGGNLLERSSMLFSADGKTLAFQRNTQPTEITLFEVATGQPKGSIAIPKQNKNVDPIGLQGAFSPDGRGLAVISERKVTLYDLATGQPRLTFDAEVASQSTVITTHGYVVAFSPDGNRLAIAGAKNLVHLADVATGRDLATFQGHTGALTGVAFAPDGKTIASSSNDGTVLIWDVTKVERHGQ